jgi:1,4-dihydroxy-2-naphthoate octaprenyltransferase
LTEKLQPVNHFYFNQQKRELRSKSLSLCCGLFADNVLRINHFYFNNDEKNQRSQNSGKQ